MMAGLQCVGFKVSADVMFIFIIFMFLIYFPVIQQWILYIREEHRHDDMLGDAFNAN